MPKSTGSIYEDMAGDKTTSFSSPAGFRTSRARNMCVLFQTHTALMPGYWYQKFPIKFPGGTSSGVTLFSPSRCHARRCLPLVSFHHQTHFSIPSVMAELDTDLYGGQSLVFSFYLVSLADTTKTSTAPTTTTSPARLKLPRICPSSTPRNQTTAKSPSVPQS
jgi:hypothetical protein